MANKFETKACCGKKIISFSLNSKISIELIKFLVSNGYKEHSHFTKSGMLYMEIKEMIISGQIGNKSLSVSCRLSNCDKYINDLELYLSKYEKNCL